MKIRNETFKGQYKMAFSMFAYIEYSKHRTVMSIGGNIMNFERTASRMYHAIRSRH